MREGTYGLKSGVCVSMCVRMCVILVWDYGARAHHFLPSWLDVIRFWQATRPLSWTRELFLFCFVCIFTWLIRRRFEQEVILLPFAFAPGVATFFWRTGLRSGLQIKALACPRASRAAVLSRWHISLLGTSGSLLTLSLQFLAHISFWHRTLGYFDDVLDLPPASTPCWLVKMTTEGGSRWQEGATSCRHPLSQPGPLKIFCISSRVALEDASDWQVCFAQVYLVHPAPHPLLVFFEQQGLQRTQGALGGEGGLLGLFCG